MTKRLQLMLKDSEYFQIQRSARAAAQHAYPTGDIDSMFAEIEAGYVKPPRRDSNQV